MQLLESRAWPNKYMWVCMGTSTCTNTCAEHFTVALKRCVQQNFHEKLNPTKENAAWQWTRSRGEATGQEFAGTFPGMFSAPEQNPSWYLLATAPRQCQAGIGHQNLLLPPRAATTNQQGPQFWAPAQTPVLAWLQFPSLMSCLRSLGQTMEAGT